MNQVKIPVGLPAGDRDTVPISVYVQTVQTFSGIMGRNLVLRRSAGRFRTDGTTIEIDPAHEVGYYILEHEIAHILFKSDAGAREAFVKMYSQSVSAAFAKANHKFDSNGFDSFMGMIIGFLEDRRVNSLWGDLYPGSAQILREWQRKDLSKKRRSRSMHQLLCEREIDFVRGTDSDENSAIGSLFSTAFRMVDRRGFASTLIASRWLVTQLVSLFVAKDQPPPPPPQSSKSAGGSPEMGEGEGEGDSEDEGEGDDAPAGGKSSPEVDKAEEARQRLAGLAALLDQIRSDGNFGESQGNGKNDFAEPPLTSKAAEAMAVRQAQDILRVSNEDAEQACEATAQAMEAIVNDVRDQLGMNGAIHHDDWLRRDLKAVVAFKDISKDATRSAKLNGEQQLVIKRLRAHFMRVIGRQATSVEDVGTEIDVRAYIDRLVTKEPIPFFKSETNGRGFEALIVLDRSGSMSGSNHRSVNIACQMLAEALNFPFVRLRVWGFNSPSPGLVNVSRFAPGTKGFVSEESSSTGRTPLHVATQLAIRELQKGKGVRHLFMLTDGQPEFQAMSGGSYSQASMFEMTHNAIVQGKRCGVNTTGIILGNCITDEQMNKTFITERHWERFEDPTLFCTELFNLVLRNFGAYLRSR